MSPCCMNIGPKSRVFYLYVMFEDGLSLKFRIKRCHDGKPTLTISQYMKNKVYFKTLKQHFT